MVPGLVGAPLFTIKMGAGQRGRMGQKSSSGQYSGTGKFGKSRAREWDPLAGAKGSSPRGENSRGPKDGVWFILSRPGGIQNWKSGLRGITMLGRFPFLVGVCLVATTDPAVANILINGSFETPVITSSAGYQTIPLRAE